MLSTLGCAHFADVAADGCLLRSSQVSCCLLYVLALAWPRRGPGGSPPWPGGLLRRGGRRAVLGRVPSRLRRFLDLGIRGHRRLHARLSDIRFFDHAQTATLPLLVLLACFRPRRSRVRALALAASAYWWLALYATQARANLLALAVACVVLAVVAGRAAWPYLKMVAVTAALGVLAYGVLLKLVPALLGIHTLDALSDAIARTASDPASGRLFLWRRATELILQHPLLGVGPMHFAHHAHDLQLGAHPHDWLLQVASEWGLPALACLLAALGLGLRALVRAGRAVKDRDGVDIGEEQASSRPCCWRRSRSWSMAWCRACSSCRRASWRSRWRWDAQSAGRGTR